MGLVYIKISLARCEHVRKQALELGEMAPFQPPSGVNRILIAGNYRFKLKQISTSILPSCVLIDETRALLNLIRI